MGPVDRLAALAGAWATVRDLVHADGRRAWFEGRSVWTPDGAGLRCVEAGVLEQDGARMAARRETLWRATPEAVEVLFADGRPFHAIRAGSAVGGTSDARHRCAPDVYDFTYDFDGWPAWSVAWRVTGPRKDYRAMTRYVRD